MPDSASQLPQFAVIVPMYNEAANAEKCVHSVCAELARIPNLTRLITIDDGSNDHTAEILDRLATSQPRLIVIRHTRNRGYGAALRTGTERAFAEGFQYVLFMDSDLTNDPADLGRFAKEMSNGADVIKATRYSNGGSVFGVPAYRVWISRAGNILARVLFRLPVHDCTNGFRAVKVKLLMGMELKESRFPVIMEELYWSKFLARTFAEVPVTLKNRASDIRPTSFSYGLDVFWKYLKYPIRAFVGLHPCSSSEEK